MNEIISLLINWYASTQKSLPWREAPTPYHVWISEIMLQQTRIEAVIPYYHRFLEQLPTIGALATVEDDRLMKLWEGLGYYSRARNLKKAAGIIITEYGGELPHTANELRKLPGIGDYTAGAIASIAFGEPEPAVDGNVLRVISRIMTLTDDILLEKTKRLIREQLRAVYPSGKDAGRLTEGLMELGETICLPGGEPRCPNCPVQEYCRAYQTGTVKDYPVKSEKKSRRIEDRTVLLLHWGEKYAIRKREPDGLLAGMWEFPNITGHLSGEEVAKEAEKLGFRVYEIHSAGMGRHIFSHVEWHMIGYEVKGTLSGESTLTWTSVGEIQNIYAIPTAFRSFTKQLEI